MKKIILICVIALCLFSTGFSQDYSTGIGIRAGFFNGLTVKHFIGTTSSLEGIFDTRWRGFEFTGLYEINHRIIDTERFNFYFGLGGHIGFWNGNYTGWGTPGRHYSVIGVDGILGLEYNFREIPFNIGLDWKPAINLIDYSGIWTDGGALSIRYIF